jgi:phosphatidylglycerol---prolipoprotein diacylglyceryl transferase
MIDFTPNPIAIQLGPLSVFWYGIGYAVGLAVAYLVINGEARRRGHDTEILANGIIVVAIAALIGGRAYHVIDQWQNLYAADPIKVFLPPYEGLGVYGGIITGTIAVILYTRWKRVSFWTWTDMIAPGLFAMQAIARWGNFFNQELYGPPTNLPWGIAIECQHRIAAYPCATYPFATTHFQPLFLYESISGLLGLLVLLFLARRNGSRLHTGQLLGVFFVWYGATRFFLEYLRADNWTFFGVPTAQIFSAGFIVAGVIVFALRGRRGPTFDEVDAVARAASEAKAAAAAAEAAAAAGEGDGPADGPAEGPATGPDAAGSGPETPGSSPAATGAPAP